MSDSYFPMDTRVEVLTEVRVDHAMTDQAMVSCYNDQQL